MSLGTQSIPRQGLTLVSSALYLQWLSPTKVHHLQHPEEAVIKGEVLVGALGAVVLDVRPTPSPQDVVVNTVHLAWHRSRPD